MRLLAFPQLTSFSHGQFRRERTFDIPVKDPGRVKSFQSLSKLSRNHDNVSFDELVVGGTHLD
jgi:hypothetical protein